MLPDYAPVGMGVSGLRGLNAHFGYGSEQSVLPDYAPVGMEVSGLRGLNAHLWEWERAVCVT